MDELLQTFPELNRSMIGDILNSVGNDLNAAKQILGDFATKEPSQERIERMLQELASFKVQYTF
jgi:hypothetical protein